jgi:hypothetical protein
VLRARGGLRGRLPAEHFLLMPGCGARLVDSEQHERAQDDQADHDRRGAQRFDEQEGHRLKIGADAPLD